MPLTKCLRCEKLFNKVKSSICPHCMPAEEQDFESIRVVINDNPDVNAETAAELSGVNIECVLRMMDAGIISNVSIGNAVKCGQCGQPAISHSKKLCQPCLKKLNHKMLQARKSISIDQKKKIQVGKISSVRQSIETKRI